MHPSFYTRSIVLTASLLLVLSGSTQSIFTSTLNTTGSAKQLPANDARFPSYSFEWNVGESTIVTTNSNGNLMVTHGLLQGFLLNEPTLEGVVACRGRADWFRTDAKVFLAVRIYKSVLPCKSCVALSFGLDL